MFAGTTARALVALAGSAALAAAAFDLGCNSNYASYYGQNSARNQQSLGEYCRDATEDLIILAFMDGFPNVMLNFANACETTFEGSTLLHCPSMAKDIKFCQSKGKAVLLSMGGASGAYGFSGDADGTKFADTVWDMFFKGNATQRPFDDAVLDGVDLDIEGGGSAGYASFISQLRLHYASDTSKRYYIAAAPQCPFPDAYLGPVLDNAWFDMVFVQFYNNYCGLNAYPGWFNFEDWDNWAKTKSVNKHVKVLIGAPGSPSAASSGYIDSAALSRVYDGVRSKYSNLGGIMTWDVSQARTSGLAGSIRAMLDAGRACTSGNSTESTSTHESASSTTAADTSSSTTDDGGSTSAEPRTVVATETETITSVSTFVTTYLTEITSETTYTSYLTAVHTYTLTGTEATAPSLNLTQSSTPPTGTGEPSAATSAAAPAGSGHAPAPASDGCPVEGAPCLESTQGCNEKGYALCVGGKWAVYPCLSGTKCYLFGGTAICDWEGVYSRRSCDVQQIQKMSSLAKTVVESIPDTASSHRAVFTSKGISSRIEFVPLSAANGRFSGLIKMQTLRKPFGGDWVLHMQLPGGQSISHVDNGRALTNGTAVSIRPESPADPALRMFVLLAIDGKYTGAYRTPNMAKASLHHV
ncbi:Chitinase 2 [Coemansia javaensis]|uniref:chitinase n=1 Tax=Coemansia javaensis TaxID=2761396 RepID=A0A9W8HN35_9FUNG|nr:Chitinase 2 [Coemansia javaensis]